MFTIIHILSQILQVSVHPLSFTPAFRLVWNTWRMIRMPSSQSSCRSSKGYSLTSLSQSASSFRSGGTPRWVRSVSPPGEARTYSAVHSLCRCWPQCPIVQATWLSWSSRCSSVEEMLSPTPTLTVVWNLHWVCAEHFSSYWMSSRTFLSNLHTYPFINLLTHWLGSFT